jgi:hypothetical protein
MQQDFTPCFYERIVKNIQLKKALVYPKVLKFFSENDYAVWRHSEGSQTDRHCEK